MSAAQRRTQLRLQKLRRSALAEATVDTQRLYVALWSASEKNQGGKIGARWKAKGLAVLQFDKSETALDIMEPIVIKTLRSRLAHSWIAALFESPTCT